MCVHPATVLIQVDPRLKPIKQVLRADLKELWDMDLKVSPACVDWDVVVCLFLPVCACLRLNNSPIIFIFTLRTYASNTQGHPYGYTPFCDSREETLGFQFWRSGYWANHLQGKVSARVRDAIDASRLPFFLLFHSFPPVTN